MLSKTHLAIGVAASLALTQPATPREVAVAVIGGALGGSIPDIDIIKNRTNVDSIITQSVAFGIAAIAIFCDIHYDYGIVRYLSSHPGSAVTGIALYIALIIIGFYAPHRGFTHSILGYLLFTAAIRTMYPPILAAYSLGYLSHLALDLLNRKPLRLFFPLHKGICLRLCYSNRKANRILFLFGTGVSVAMLLYSGIQIVSGRI